MQCQAFHRDAAGRQSIGKPAGRVRALHQQHTLRRRGRDECENAVATGVRRHRIGNDSVLAQPQSRASTCCNDSRSRKHARIETPLCDCREEGLNADAARNARQPRLRLRHDLKSRPVDEIAERAEVRGVESRKQYAPPRARSDADEEHRRGRNVAHSFQLRNIDQQPRHSALPRRRSPLDKRSGRVRRPSVGKELRHDIGDHADPHEDHQRVGAGHPLDDLAARLTRRHNGERTPPTVAGQGEPGGRRCGDTRTLTGYNIAGNTTRVEVRRFLVAAPEDERIAALQPDDAPTGPGVPGQQIVDLILTLAGISRAEPDDCAASGNSQFVQEPRRHETVHNDHLGLQ